jgi:hypothetical protein
MNAPPPYQDSYSGTFKKGSHFFGFLQSMQFYAKNQTPIATWEQPTKKENWSSPPKNTKSKEIFHYRNKV